MPAATHYVQQLGAFCLLAVVILRIPLQVVPVSAATPSPCRFRVPHGGLQVRARGVVPLRLRDEGASRSSRT